MISLPGDFILGYWQPSLRDLDSSLPITCLSGYKRADADSFRHDGKSRPDKAPARSNLSINTTGVFANKMITKKTTIQLILAKQCWYPAEEGMRRGLRSAMASLQVILLNESARAPTVAHPGEDIGYDLYSNHNYTLVPGQVHRVQTGVAVAGEADGSPLGFLVRDRSSMAASGVFTHGGVIDATYRGEIIVLMSTLTLNYEIQAGDRIAQLVPTPVLTGVVNVAAELSTGARGSKGFGSSGR